MAESPSSTRKSNPQKVMTVMDMRVVQQLMQLSDEDNKNNNRKNDKDEVVDQPRSDRSTTMAKAKIEEIFGKEDAYRPKKRRYRSLVSIYTATKPMNLRYGKKLRSSTNPSFVTDYVKEF